ncbi:MAG: MBL fold metallo-hydrolase [Promethearchaeota archaeon]
MGCSCSRVTEGKTRILVDCGGDPKGKSSIQLPPEDIARLKAIIITHAHFDHYGGLFDLIAKNIGTNSQHIPTIFCTESTRDLIMKFGFKEWLQHGRGASHLNQARRNDIFTMLRKKMVAITFGKTFPIGEIGVTLLPASHILGSAQVHLKSPFSEGMFTSDFKPSGTFLLRGFSPRELNEKFGLEMKPDFIVIESTYEKTREMHDLAKIENTLVSTIKNSFQQGGNLLIPCFAIGRAQEFMTYYHALCNKYPEITPLNFFLVGSINNMNQLYIKAIEPHHRDSNGFRNNAEDLLEWQYLSSIHDFTTYFKIKGTRGDMRQRIAHLKGNGFNIFISSGGMLQGPAMELFLELKNSPKNAMFLVGYQAEGTSGRAVLDAARAPEKRRYLLFDGKKIFPNPSISAGTWNRERSHYKGKSITFKFKVLQLPLFSAHATFDEKISYLREFSHLAGKPITVFTTHGAPRNCADLARDINSIEGLSGISPELGDNFPL